jgi:hypothetical protein
VPQAIPFAAAYVVSNAAAAAGATVAAQATAAATAATIAASVQTTALILGASYAVAKLTAPEAPKPSSQSSEFKQPLPVRFFTYGAAKVSGPVALLEVLDDAPHTLFKIVVFGTRELGSFQRLYVDGVWAEVADLVSNPAIGESQFTFNSESAAYLYRGTDDQLRSTAITWPGWTDNHRLRGIPYVAAYFGPGLAADFNENYPGSSPPEFGMVGGVKVYDPRKDSTNGGSGSHRMDDPSSWEFSDNQRLVALDWITHPEGYNKSWDRIDWATWVPQINMADQDVPLKAGGTEKRYRVATIVYLNEPRGRVLRRILDAGDQQLYTTAAGLIGSRGGVWQAPTVFLAATELLEGQFTHGVPMIDRVNEFTLTAMLPTHEYNEIELKPWANKTDPEYIAGIVRNQPLDLSQVPSNAQAQRLAKIRMAKINPRWSGSIRTDFAGLNALGEAAVHLSFDELNAGGGFNGNFLVNGKIGFSPDKTGVTLSVSAIDPACYNWNAATEEQDAPPVPEDDEEAVTMQEAA